MRPALPAAARPAVWMLSRETASAAFSAQMLAAPKRGLKADPAERARFARAYQSWGLPQPGLIANDNV